MSADMCVCVKVLLATVSTTHTHTQAENHITKHTHIHTYTQELRCVIALLTSSMLPQETIAPPYPTHKYNHTQRSL